MIRNAFFLVLFVLSLVACKKAEDRRCLKTAGEDTKLTHLVESFNKLDLGPRIRYVLVQDTVEKVVVKGGENLVNLVSVNVTDGTLKIENTNTCNFLRSYKYVVEVEIHLVNLINVLFKGTKELSCKNQLNVPYLTFVIEEGGGTCKLNLNCYSLYVGSGFGWGNFVISGQTNYAKIDLRDNGFGDLYDLNILDSATVISYSSETLKMNFDGAAIRAETGSYGDLWYIGTPTFLEYNRYGDGNLFDKN